MLSTPSLRQHQLIASIKIIVVIRDVPINAPVCQTASYGTCGEAAHGAFLSERRGGKPIDENAVHWRIKR